MVKIDLNEKKVLKLIHSFIEKQRKCEKMINSGLSFRKNTSVLRKKILLGSQGFITKKPDWKFYFHGKGVRLTNSKTNESIDYDYLELLIGGKRKIGGFDSWRLSLFVENQIESNNLDRKIFFVLTKQVIWDKILIHFVTGGLIKKISR
jgi:hypothetical protein